MASRPWYRRFPADIISKTGTLNATERGIYSSLLDNMYLHWAPLIWQPKTLAMLCGCSTKQFNLTVEKLIAMGLLVREGDSLTNHRFEKECETSAKDAQIAAKNGAKGGQKFAENNRKFNSIKALTGAKALENQEPSISTSQNLEEKLASFVPETRAGAPLIDASPMANVQTLGQASNNSLGDRSRFPRLSDKPHLWVAFTGRSVLDEQGTARPYVGRYRLDTVCAQVCKAARITDPNWRGDWDVVMRWLNDGISSNKILDAIEEVAARPGFTPKATLRYFDGAVRQYDKANPGQGRPRELIAS